MTTASLLESITDRSRFELLATSVLRKADPNYAAIIQTGINAVGETIVSPLDGIHLIPHSNPPHYVFVQHTTTDLSGLRKKWLTKVDADLPKAVSEARKIRQNLPNAKFTVVLCTNQRLNVELVRDVTQVAVVEGLGIDIWEQHRIADFLDTTADGHWLRKIYLGIEAERLSEELLRDLCRQSIEAYRREVLLPGHNLLVHRAVIDQIHNAFSSDECSLCLTLGSSGYGKSVVSLQVLEERYKAGFLGIWLPARYLENATLIESALGVWLRTLHPFLEPDAGRIAIGLSAGIGRLVIVVDDINRTADPIRLLRSLIGAASPSSDETIGVGGNDQGSRKPAVLPLVLVVPLWPDHLQHFPDHTLGKSWIHIVSVGEMLPDESSQIIQAASSSLSDIEVRDFADHLGHDPFLVGLFASIISGSTEHQKMRVIAEDVVGRFIDSQLANLIASGSTSLLPTEYREMFRTLSFVRGSR